MEGSIKCHLPDTAFARYLCRSRLLRGLSWTSNLSRKGETRKKKGILFGLLYFATGYTTPGTGYWILETTGLLKFNHSLYCLGKTRILAESPLFGKGLRVIRKYWIQERNYSGRSVHQLKVSINVHPSLCPRSHLFPSCLAYFLFRFLIFGVMLLAGNLYSLNYTNDWKWR